MGGKPIGGSGINLGGGPGGKCGGCGIGGQFIG